MSRQHQSAEYHQKADASTSASHSPLVLSLHTYLHRCKANVYASKGAHLSNRPLRRFRLIPIPEKEKQKSAKEGKLWLAVYRAPPSSCTCSTCTQETSSLKAWSPKLSNSPAPTIGWSEQTSFATIYSPSMPPTSLSINIVRRLRI